ncbi:late competence development ComFB family protein [Teredinibacter waterburyi]|jgi:Late competence development protein ComFB.|uniref:late competence development ComFB family protein n=1 Tax=Teredinibacter waterburyi TaxID=1500538 RepID=UPI00165F8D85|nr:late competence development ComFB family protein [Teredinibacter waterburyi]
MLLGAGRHKFQDLPARDSVHNYYEHIVTEQLLRANDRVHSDPDFMADVLCVALNRLPPRYVRHDVDMTFFLSPTEMEEMTNKVVKAVNDAVTYVESRGERSEEDPSE